MSTMVESLPAGIKRTLAPNENANLSTEIETFEKKIKLLENEIKNQSEIETKVEKLFIERKEQATSKIDTSMRYSLMAPPNLMYHDDIIIAFLFCPICVSDGHGEFCSAQEAKAHVQSNRRHSKIVEHGGKRYLDSIKCTRCRLCGIDVFGGDQVLSHLMSDRHRLNSVGNWDANTPTMLNMTLDKIEIDALQPQLEDYCEKLKNDFIKKEYRVDIKINFSINASYTHRRCERQIKQNCNPLLQYLKMHQSMQLQILVNSRIVKVLSIPV